MKAVAADTPRASATVPLSRRHAFLALLCGQTVSMFGSSLTGFALGVWVYQSTGSVTRFALIAFCTTLPGIALLPLAGLIADRFDRRWVMLLSDTGAALGTLAIAGLLFFDQLATWHLYLLMSCISACNAPQLLAFQAVVPQLVAPQQLGQANGLSQLGGAVAEIGAPLIAGVLVVQLPLASILLIDGATFLFAVATLLWVRVPGLATGAQPSDPSAASEPWRDRLLSGFRFILKRPGLSGLVAYFTVLNFSRGAVLVLITPLVLAIADPAALGQVLAIGAAGMLAGGLVMTVWGGPQSAIAGIQAGTLVYGLALTAGGLRPSLALIAVTAFVLIATGPFINGLVQTLWQRKVPPALQGRVFAARRMCSWSAIPLAQLVSGPLADFVFTPAMAQGGAWTPVLAPLFGSGPGRGVGVFMSLLGLLGLATCLTGWLYRPLRQLDQLPDALAAESPNRAATPLLVDETTR